MSNYCNSVQQWDKFRFLIGQLYSLPHDLKSISVFVDGGMRTAAPPPFRQRVHSLPYCCQWHKCGAEHHKQKRALFACFTYRRTVFGSLNTCPQQLFLFCKETSSALVLDMIYRSRDIWLWRSVRFANDNVATTHSP